MRIASIIMGAIALALIPTLAQAGGHGFSAGAHIGGGHGVGFSAGFGGGHAVGFGGGFNSFGGFNRGVNVNVGLGGFGGGYGVNRFNSFGGGYGGGFNSFNSFGGGYGVTQFATPVYTQQVVAAPVQVYSQQVVSAPVVATYGASFGAGACTTGACPAPVAGFGAAYGNAGFGAPIQTFRRVVVPGAQFNAQFGY